MREHIQRIDNCVKRLVFEHNGVINQDIQDMVGLTSDYVSSALSRARKEGYLVVTGERRRSWRTGRLQTVYFWNAFASPPNAACVYLQGATHKEVPFNQRSVRTASANALDLLRSCPEGLATFEVCEAQGRMPNEVSATLVRLAHAGRVRRAPFKRTNPATGCKQTVWVAA